MNAERFNDLAALLEGDLSPEEREAILERLSEDPEAMGLLASLLQPGASNGPLPKDLPFPINRKIRIGVHDRIFRMFDLNSVRLTPGQMRAAEAVERISEGRLPYCRRQSVEILLEGEFPPGVLRVEKKGEGEGLDIHVELDREAEQYGYLEFWCNGALIQATPANSISDRPLLGIETNGTWAVRHHLSPVGLGIRLAEVPFESVDWLGASLSQVVEGNLVGAAQLLVHQRPMKSEGPGLWERLSGRLSALGEIAACPMGVLQPAPMTRHPSHTRSGIPEILEPVWSGVQDSWPEARGLPEPWGVRPTTGNADLPAGLNRLITALRMAAMGEPIPPRPTLSEMDDHESEAWAALEGWLALVEGEFQTACDRFTSTLPTGSDRFGLRVGAGIAGHLARAEGEDGPRTDQAVSSSEEVWRALFSEVIHLEKESG